jgi:hypothetical protein
VTDPIDRPGEIARLRALLGTTRLERDELARRLAAALDGPPAMVAGQLSLPGMPHPHRLGGRSS